MAKHFIVRGTITHKFKTVITVSHEDELDDAIANAIEGGDYDEMEYEGHYADDIESAGTTLTLEDYINE